jgi:archaellum component FlaF (FlaF/FlaG flagellin family)
MLYSIVGALFLIAALVVIVYTIYNSMIKEFTRINNELNKINNDKEEK